jgi:GTPase involved in cell partitioning and DNA repair
LKIADLDQEGQFSKVATGGSGGKGNMTVNLTIQNLN